MPVTTTTTTPRATVLHGDALDILKTLGDASVHAVITDPPYALDKNGEMVGQVAHNYHQRGSHTQGYAGCDMNAFRDWCREWATECGRVLLPGGHLLAFGGNRSIFHLGCAIDQAGLEIRDEWIWLYATGRAMGLQHTGPDGELHATTVKTAHEPIVVARRPLGPTGTRVQTVYETHGTAMFNIDATRIGTKGYWPSNVMIDEAAANLLGTGEHFFIAKPDATERITVDGVRHPTVKPLDLMRQLVRRATPPGGVVLDPFAGSGTTLEAAVLEGRDTVGIERDATYLPLIKARLRRAAS